MRFIVKLNEGVNLITSSEAKADHRAQELAEQAKRLGKDWRIMILTEEEE